MTYIAIDIVGGALDQMIYLTNTDEEVALARAALSAADLEYAEEYTGDPDCPSSHKNGNKLFAIPVKVSAAQIVQLAVEADAAGDGNQVMLCDLALHGPRYLVDNYSLAEDLLKKARRAGRSDFQTWAIEECAKAIDAAQACMGNQDVDVHVAASVATPTTTGVEGALDVDVTVTIDGKEYDGEVTLVRSEQDGCWIAYGPDPSYWISSSLLSVLNDLPKQSFRAALDAIESAAAKSCDEAS